MELNLLTASRFALSIDYVWFGALKVLGLSPAAALVIALQKATLPFLPDNVFLFVFGIFEVALGVLLLFPRFTKWVYPVMWAHMVTTFLPLFVLPEFSWQSLLVPTLVGQYILKNFALVMLSVWVYRESKS